MKTILRDNQDGAYGLLLTVAFVGIGSIALAGVLNWAQSSARLNDRNNEYITSVCAAEGAIEKVRAQMGYDYVNGTPEPVIYSLINTYKRIVPSSADDPMWKNYSFSDPTLSGVSATLIKKLGTNVQFASPVYKGLTSYASDYQIIANVQNTASQYKIPVCVGAELLLGTTPLFQYAVFYQEDMEIHPGAPMTINGLIHGNADIYLSSSSSAGLTILDTLSASGNVYTNQSKSGDGPSRGNNVTFSTKYYEGVSQQNLPIGTNQTISGNGANNVHAVLDVPPPGEGYAYNGIGTNRYYNKADLIIKVTPTNMVALSGVSLGNSVQLTNFPFQAIVDTTGVLHDSREGCDVNTTAINIGALKTWSETNVELRGLSKPLGDRDISTVYAVDQRNYTLTPTATNNILITNRTTSATYPSSGTYVGNVTLTNSGPLLYSAPPLPSNATNITLTKSTNITGKTSLPSDPSTYTNARITGYWPTTWSYTLFTQYSYNVINYSYWAITGTNQTISYLTNSVAEAAIVLTNGTMMPRSGLTFATPNPVYIKGDYNVNTDGKTAVLGSTNTDNTRPAAILCDAITILSAKWKDSLSMNGGSVNNRAACDTTVNAAFLAGNVPTDSGGYSGGVENFPRFLENWANFTFTYNGSMVVLFPSQVGVGRWGQANVYSPPNRNWSFDHNFLSAQRLPTNTPNAVLLTRGTWKVLPAGSTGF